MARKLAKNVYVGETFYAAGSEPPKEDAEQITNPAAWGDTDADEDGGTDYGSLKLEELQAEADSRGLAVDGSGKDGKVLKKDLVAALESNDNA